MRRLLLLAFALGCGNLAAGLASDVEARRRIERQVAAFVADVEASSRYAGFWA